MRVHATSKKSGNGQKESLVNEEYFCSFLAPTGMCGLTSTYMVNDSAKAMVMQSRPAGASKQVLHMIQLC